MLVRYLGELGFRWRFSEEADYDERSDCDEKSRKNRVAICQDVRKKCLDCWEVPCECDDGAAGDGSDGSPSCDPFRIECREDDGGKGSGVDGVGPKHLLQNALSVDGLIQRPAPEKHDGEPRNDEDPLVGCIWRDIADEHVVDQVGCRGEQIV